MVLTTRLDRRSVQPFNRSTSLSPIPTPRYNKLETHELNIIQGALKLKKMNVAEIMTNLEDVFSLPIKSVLDFDTLSLIQKSGFSRIPIFDQERSNIVAVLFAKDLAFVDPDDKVNNRFIRLHMNSFETWIDFRLISFSGSNQNALRILQSSSQVLV